MRTAVEIEEALYTRLEREAALRGRSVGDLVAEVRRVLEARDAAAAPAAPEPTATSPWCGVLRAHAANAAGAHGMAAVRASIAVGRRGAV